MTIREIAARLLGEYRWTEEGGWMNRPRGTDVWEPSRALEECTREEGIRAIGECGWATLVEEE